MRERREMIQKDRNMFWMCLKIGGKKAEKKNCKKNGGEVRTKIGLNLK